ncbi:unnamed protein product [Brachionus calyciflorus]|uniref:Beta-galactosidase n=1 Tax=Brachionus calyciflorus TaxID=104777 RepID=A0A814MYS5_9BILA|nr:unnamed protein product [Brachionus calyciflorus]
MKIIRFNRGTFVKLTLCVLIYISFRTLLDFLNQPEKPSLEFDSSNREFYLHVPRKFFETDQKISQNHNDFYLFDQNTEAPNQKIKINFQIKSAKLDYSKLFLEDWVEFLENAVEIGLNTIEIEIVWNLHEKVPGDYDLKTDNLDLEELFKLVKDYKLFLLVRIDPYLPCSDYDLGGLPNWLLSDTNLETWESKSKSTHGLLNLKNDQFLSFYRGFLNQLMPILLSYQFINNGPIIGLLIQNYMSNDLNSYQSFYNGDYRNYLEFFLKNYGFVEAILKSISLCEYNGFFDTVNFTNYCDPNMVIYLPLDYKFRGKQNHHHDCSSTFFPTDKNAFLVPEEIISNEIIKTRSNLNELLIMRKSFCIKSFYCYNNFGFSNEVTNSLTQSNKYQYCLIDHIGNKTPKYNIVFNVLNSKSSKYFNYTSQLKLRSRKLTESEFTSLNLIEIPITHFLSYKNLIDNLHAPVDLQDKKQELFMEYINIVYNVKSNGLGYILYRIKVNLKAGSSIIVNTNYIKDYSILLCDSDFHVISIDSMKTNGSLSIRLHRDCNELHVLVENSGRLSRLENKTFFSNQRKGILVKNAILFKRPENDAFEIGGLAWKINFFDFLPKFFNRVTFNSQYVNITDTKINNVNSPIMIYAKFYAEKSNYKEYVYLILKNFKKGVVFLNGFNLGRYLESNNFGILFIPKKLIIDGSNEIVIFELHGFHSHLDYQIFITKEYIFL